MTYNYIVGIQLRRVLRGTVPGILVRDIPSPRECSSGYSSILTQNLLLGEV